MRADGHHVVFQVTKRSSGKLSLSPQSSQTKQPDRLSPSAISPCCVPDKQLTLQACCIDVAYAFVAADLNCIGTVANDTGSIASRHASRDAARARRRRP